MLGTKRMLGTKFENPLMSSASTARPHRGTLSHKRVCPVASGDISTMHQSFRLLMSTLLATMEVRRQALQLYELHPSHDTAGFRLSVENKWFPPGHEYMSLDSDFSKSHLAHRPGDRFCVSKSTKRGFWHFPEQFALREFSPQVICLRGGANSRKYL